ncbi:hypothetical protein ACFQX6_15890 [Streptosporangium lutulentum]
MKPLLRRNGFWLALSLVLCLISGIGASFVQTVAAASPSRTCAGRPARATC